VKIPRVEADLFHKDTDRERQRTDTDMLKIIYTFCNLRTHRKFMTPQNKQLFFPDTVINYVFL